MLDKSEWLASQVRVYVAASHLFLHAGLPTGARFYFHFDFSRFWLVGAIFGWVGKATPDPLPKRSSAAFDRGGQTGPPRSNAFSSGAADDTGAADDRQLGGRCRIFCGGLPLGNLIDGYKVDEAI